MDFDDSPEEAGFRAEARTWLAGAAPPRGESDDTWRRFRAKTEVEDLAFLAEAKAFQHRLVDAGWAGVHWPVEHGGQGRSAQLAGIFEQERGRFDVPGNFFMVGIDMAGPTLMAHGSADQQAKYLRPMLRGDEVWCQLFSEPGSGSDLASLATRAERDGDTWVVNGQKVWTSSAHLADRGILLARTDPDAPKHAGITYFVVDMKARGVEVRPLRQIDGAIHFNEVFLTDVHIPDADVIGPVGEGWKVALTTLTAERSAIGGGGHTGYDEVLALARETGRTDDLTVRQELARLRTRTEIQRWLVYRTRTALARGVQPGPEASVLKLLNNHQVAHVGDLVMALLGAGATLSGDDAARAGSGRTCSSTSGAAASAAAPSRSSATSWPSGCSVSPASPTRSAGNRGERSPVANPPNWG